MQDRLPQKIVLPVYIISVLPLLLPLVKIDLTNSSPIFDFPFHNSLHTYFEWTAVCISFVTVLLAFLYFRFRYNEAVLLLGLAMFTGGCMDALHILTADGLLFNVQNMEFLPFTWAISQLSIAIILLSGITLLKTTPKVIDNTNIYTALGFGIFLALMSVVVIALSAGVEYLPNMIYPDRIIVRPYDLIPLAGFLIVGIRFHLLYKKNPSVFVHSIAVSVIPLAATQAYMAFGSHTLFDHNFIVAHITKLVAYSVPFSALTYDYIRTYRKEQDNARSLERLVGIQKITESALRQSERKYKMVLDNAFDAIYIIRGKQYIYVNPRFCEMVEYSSEELTSPDFDYNVLLTNKSKSLLEKRYQARLRGETVPVQYEAEVVSKSGEILDMEVTTAIIGESGELLVQGIMRDITARRQFERKLKANNTKLKTYAKELENVNADLEQYAYVVSHDIKSPLRAIHNYADFLSEDLHDSLSGEPKEFLSNLGKAVRQAEALVDDLLMLSRVGRANIVYQKVNIKELIDQIVVGYRSEANIEFENNCPDVLLPGEPTLLKQIFQNLINNGIKFNNSNPKTVSITGQNTAEGNYELFITDNGIGIESQYFEKIFGVFQRLHSEVEYEGTGIGLAIVKKAVNRLNGYVRLESEVGKGSTFVVGLPLMQET